MTLLRTSCRVGRTGTTPASPDAPSPAGSNPSAPASCTHENCGFCEAKLYSGLSAKQATAIRDCLSLCGSGPRETLFHAGDPSRYLYVIREGQVKITRTDMDGCEHLLSLAGPGYFLGFDTIGNPAYSYNAETLTPSVFCRIRHDDIMRLLKREPRISLNVLFAVNEQLAQARNLIRVLGQKTAMEKLAAFLLSLFPPGSGKAGAGSGAMHLSRREIAEILGLRLETISRNMAQLRRRRILDAPRGRIVITDRARLQLLSGVPPPRRRAAGHRKKRPAS